MSVEDPKGESPHDSIDDDQANDCECGKMPDGFPCAPCYISGHKELTDDE